MISRGETLKLGKKIHSKSRAKNKEKYILALSIFMGIISALLSFNISFKCAFLVTFGYTAFVISKNKISNLSILPFIIIPFFSMGIGYSAKILIIFILMNILHNSININKNTLTYITLCALSVFLSSIFVNYAFLNNSMNVIYMLAEVIGTIISFYIFNEAYALVLSVNKKNVTLMQSICLSASILILFIPFMNIDIYGIYIIKALLYFLIMSYITYFSFESAIVFSILSSVCLYLFAGNNIDVILLINLATLLTSVTKNINKVLIALLFPVSTFVFAYLTSSNLVYASEYKEFILSSFIFVITYILFSEKIYEVMEKKEDIQTNVFNSAIKKTIKEEIDNKKNMIKEIGYNISLNKPSEKINVTKTVCSYLTKDICSNCDKFNKCWKEDGENTFVNFSKVILDTYNKQITKPKDVPLTFKNNCKYSFFMFNMINYLGTNIKNESEYNKKLSKFKNLIAMQFNSVNTSLDNIYENFKKGLNYYSKDEENIKKALEEKNIKLDEIVVLEDFNNTMKVYLKCENRLSSDEYRLLIPDILSTKLKRNIHYDYNSFSEESCATYEYTFIQTMPYSLSVGVRRENKYGKKVSGDNYANKILPTNKHLIALSDGMGSGEKANLQSKRVLNLFEEMLSCGDKEEDSVNTINSILCLEDSEVFTTLDVMIFNSQTANAEFIKAGATETFLKRDKEILTLDAQALPIGILEKTKLATTKIPLKDGDYLYFMSDGFIESFDNDKEEIKSKLLSYQYRNPQRIADELFKELLMKNHNKLKDDTSIMIVKIRKEI